MKNLDGLTNAQLRQEGGWDSLEPGSDLRRARPKAESVEAPTVNAVDVTELEGESDEDDTPMVVEHLRGENEIRAVTGDEGDGKTTFVDQLQRQMLRGEDVFGF